MIGKCLMLTGREGQWKLIIYQVVKSTPSAHPNNIIASNSPFTLILSSNFPLVSKQYHPLWVVDHLPTTAGISLSKYPLLFSAFTIRSKQNQIAYSNYGWDSHSKAMLQMTINKQANVRFFIEEQATGIPLLFAHFLSSYWPSDPIQSNSISVHK